MLHSVSPENTHFGENDTRKMKAGAKNEKSMKIFNTEIEFIQIVSVTDFPFFVFFAIVRDSPIKSLKNQN